MTSNPETGTRIPEPSGFGRPRTLDNKAEDSIAWVSACTDIFGKKMIGGNVIGEKIGLFRAGHRFLKTRLRGEEANLSIDSDLRTIRALEFTRSRAV